MSRKSDLHARLTRLYEKGALRASVETYAPGDGRQRWLVQPASGESERTLGTLEAEAFALGAEAAFAALSRRLHDAGRPASLDERARRMHQALAEEAERLEALAEELPTEGAGVGYRQRLRRAGGALRGVFGEAGL